MGLFRKTIPEPYSGHIQSCYSLSEIPDRKITKSFGIVYFVTPEDIDSDIHKQVPNIFHGLLEAAKKIGANAVVNIKLSSGCYGGGSHIATCTHTYVIAYGDAVSLVDG